MQLTSGEDCDARGLAAGCVNTDVGSGGMRLPESDLAGNDAMLCAGLFTAEPVEGRDRLGLLVVLEAAAIKEDGMLPDLEMGLCKAARSPLS